MNYILKDYRLAGSIDTHVQGAHRYFIVLIWLWK